MNGYLFGWIMWMDICFKPTDIRRCLPILSSYPNHYIYIYIYIYIYVIYVYIYTYIIWTVEAVEEWDFQYREKFSRLVSTLRSFSKDIILYLSNLQRISLFDVNNKPDVIRGGSRDPTASKMEFYMKTVDDLKP